MQYTCASRRENLEISLVVISLSFEKSKYLGGLPSTPFSYNGVNDGLVRTYASRPCFCKNKNVKLILQNKSSAKGKML